MCADGVDDVGSNIGEYRRMLLWMLWKDFDAFLRMRGEEMSVSINFCGICGGSTLGGILGGLAKLIPALSGDG